MANLDSDMVAGRPVRRPRWEADGDVLRLWAPAKINLNLLVGSRREDGFHSLDSVVAKVTLYDEITIRPSEAGVAFSCAGADCGNDEKNLALLAARLMLDHFRRGSDGGLDVTLQKHIPPGKGLGGGSSDAAAVLTGVDRLWRLGLRDSSEGLARLMRLAATLGSDVPLFLGPPVARMTGRGEIVEAASAHPFWAVLILPAESTSTAAVYREFDSVAAQTPRRLDAAASGRIDPAMFESPPSLWRGDLRNDLTEAAMRVCPSLRALMDAASAATALPVCLTGSGSAMFILCDSREEASRAVAAMPRSIADMCRVVECNSW